jgi:restriction endonuclease S subunit
VRLGDYTEECTETVRPWEQPEKDWPVYGVNNKDGVFLNSYQQGADFNAPYKRIEKDWFFHNPTRANVGSLGIVPDVPEDAITSPEYQVWRLTGGFLPEFMALLIRTDYFLSLVAFNRVGGVKQRMYYANLAEIRLPLVPIEEQRRVANEYASLLSKISAARTDLERRKDEIEQMILGTLKVEGN